MCSKLTIKIPATTSHVILVFLLLSVNIFLPFYSVYIIYFEQVNVSCGESFDLKVRAE